MFAGIRLSSYIPRRSGGWVALCVALAIELPVSSAEAQPSPDRGVAEEGVRWKEHWPRFHAAEYAATSILMGGAIVGSLVGPKNVVRWSDTNGFDDGVRDGLRIGSLSGQAGAGTASDVLLSALILYPYVDAGVAWLAHDAPDVAWQMAMINTQSLAFTAALTTGIKMAAGRKRPNTRACEASGKADDPECMGGDYASSFFSGHSAMAFTAASLVCTHHANLKLYGGGAPDYLACIASLGAATATGMLRIAADRHYATDVLTGAAVGVVSGWLLPNLLHYRFGAAPDGSDRVSGDDNRPRISVTPLGGASFVGLGVMGTF